MAAPAKTIVVDKNNKYDRQLRLWGDHGQSSLETARVCLINASATGTEILKNLILPGVGSFTIVDGHKVQGEDVGNNFFLTMDSIGKSRAQIASELLSELNEDVAGDFLEENVDDLLHKNPAFFSSFSTVIATQLEERTLLNLGKVLWERNIPLIVCRCYGLIGYLRVVIREHTVIESHPDNSHEDLRLDRPFEGLKNYCQSLDLSSMSKKDHSHTPWLVILYKFLQQWHQQHPGRWPGNYKDKNELKEMIKQGVRKNEEGVPEEEENFDEAIKSVNSSLNMTTVPSEVKALFDDPSCWDLNSDSKNFWIMVRALKEFTENEGGGLFPLRGSIPDMTSDSERYIQLQSVYREQAEVDFTAVAGHVHALLHNIGRNISVLKRHDTVLKGILKGKKEDNNNSFDELCGPQSPSVMAAVQSCLGLSQIQRSGLSFFKPFNLCGTDCKDGHGILDGNSAFLTVLRCRNLDEEYEPATANVEELGRHIMEEAEVASEEGDDTVLYILLRAADKFFVEYNRYPGYFDNTVEADIPKLRSCLNRLLHDWGLNVNIKDDYVQEMCRYGAAELHTMSAFMGGVVAQEVIKVVTGQFVPINNTFLYNGHRQTSTTVTL